MALQLDDLALLEVEADIAAGLKQGTPLILPIGSIDEDPAQPRREFDLVALQELADTITLRGVRQPVSVRPHPDAGQAGRWMLNFGARRLRASKLAGKLEIPAFVDVLADSYDQVIENEQREGLKPLELALFVQRRLAAGDSQADIARRLGKSRTYVMYATALIDAPACLMAAYRDGRCRGARELHELRGLHADHAQLVETWLAQTPAVTRERINVLRSELNAQAPTATPVVAPAIAPTVDTKHARAEVQIDRGEHKLGSRPLRQASPPKQLVLLASFEAKLVELVFDKLPTNDEDVRVRPVGGGQIFDVTAASLSLLRVVQR